ncbi:winged helix-turn-helix transcriptional regulator [Larkinella soli]|uniref:winged helix-turn-helix transcriptional regulator n=1 Tax=Larkinella soli TaxID=1770527 RepID=UPI000FFB6C40|nr:helix-turn-helix domain-containing protein [Larkinella soli]
MAPQEGTAVFDRHTAVTIAEFDGGSGEKKFRKIFEEAQQTRNGPCPVRDVIARISDKWSLLTILLLGGYGTLRFNEIRHRIGDISQRMLTVTLRHLEEDGLVSRRIYAEVPPRVEYDLTPLGRSLMEQVSLLTEWATLNGTSILDARRSSRRKGR